MCKTDYKIDFDQVMLLPAQKMASLSCAIVIYLHIVKITVSMVLQIEGSERQPDDVSRCYSNVPGAVGTMRVVVRMTWTSKTTCRSCEGVSTACLWNHMNTLSQRVKQNINYFIAGNK